DWVGHINTVDHTAACRDLRNKYPDWNPNLPSSPQGKYRREAYVHRPHGRTYSSHQHSQIHYHTGIPHFKFNTSVKTLCIEHVIKNVNVKQFDICCLGSKLKRFAMLCIILSYGPRRSSAKALNSRDLLCMCC
ncbi:hypothetical protein CHARACLAT_026096, partial [Characodon lateralis]|nr:hypothetical protein [Characodon lateralis]